MLAPDDEDPEELEDPEDDEGEFEDGAATVTLVPPILTFPTSFGFAGSLTSVASTTVKDTDAVPAPPAVAVALTLPPLSHQLPADVIVALLGDTLTAPS